MVDVVDQDIHVAKDIQGGGHHLFRRFLRVIVERHSQNLAAVVLGQKFHDFVLRTIDQQGKLATRQGVCDVGAGQAVPVGYEGYGKVHKGSVRP